MRSWLKTILVVAAMVPSAKPSTADMMNGTRITIDGANYAAQNDDRNWSLSAEGTPPCIYHFELRSGDVWKSESIAHGSLVERSELTGLADQTNVGAFDSDIWTAYQFRINPGPPSTAPWVVLGDWHIQMDPGDAFVSSPWQLELLPGDILAFDTRTSSEKPILANPAIHDIWKSFAPTSRGVWHSIVSRAIFDWRPTGNGAIDVWLDGLRIVNYRGPVGYSTTRPPYFKFGIYRASVPEPLAVDYANVTLTRSPLSQRISEVPEVCGKVLPIHE